MRLPNTNLNLFGGASSVGLLGEGEVTPVDAEVNEGTGVGAEDFDTGVVVGVGVEVVVVVVVFAYCAFVNPEAHVHSVVIEVDSFSFATIALDQSRR